MENLGNKREYKEILKSLQDKSNATGIIIPKEAFERDNTCSKKFYVSEYEIQKLEKKYLNIEWPQLQTSLIP